MNNYENIIKMNKKELASFLDKYNNNDGAPWIKYFDENYCQKCDSIKGKNINGRDMEYAFCELNEFCRFFQEKGRDITCEEIIELWLDEECKGE